MELDLVDGGRHLGLARQSLQVGDLEVADADRPGSALLLELLKRLPRRDEVAAVQGRQGPVDQEQVDVVDAQLGQCPVERTAGVSWPVKAVVVDDGIGGICSADCRTSSVTCWRRRCHSAASAAI